MDARAAISLVKLALAMTRQPLRVIDSGPGDGPWNMALDEALLASAAQQGGICLRWYQWQPATLSLGYFQRLAERKRHAASQRCAVVRRASGGGAILHDRELTYSLTIAHDHPLAKDAEGLYRQVHQILIDVLQTHGVAAKFCQAEAKKLKSAEAPFLCFQRRTSGDLVLGGEKIVGSAQRRHRGAILQHGSVLLSASSWAPELPGIREISGVDLSAERLADAVVTQFAQSLQLEAVPDQCTAAETALSHEFTNHRYGHPRWTELR